VNSGLIRIIVPRIVFTAIIFGIFVFILYKIFFSWGGLKVTSQMIQIANEITKYPHAKSWIIEKHEDPCSALGGCPVPVIEIKFDSDDNWGQVHNFYKKDLNNDGWKLSLLADSVYTEEVSPIDVGFNKDGCGLSLENQVENGSRRKGKYVFHLEC